MSIMNRLSGMFGAAAAVQQPQERPPESEPPSSSGLRLAKTHRQRLAERGEDGERDDDITKRYATAFAALDETASKAVDKVCAGADKAREVAAELVDQSDRLKKRLASG
jgi:hypothetical protein